MRRESGALAWIILGVAPWCSAGSLYLGTPRVESDRTLVPVMVEADGGVAAMDFRLRYDPAVFEPLSTTPGPAADAAGKQVAANTPYPGEHIVVVMGLNQNAVADGEVAQVVLRNVGAPTGGRSRIEIAEPTMATADGVEVPAEGGTVEVDFGGTPPASPGETPAAPGTPPAAPPATPSGPETPKPAPVSRGPGVPPMPALAGAAAAESPREAAAGGGAAEALERLRDTMAAPAAPTGAPAGPDGPALEMAAATGQEASKSGIEKTSSPASSGGKIDMAALPPGETFESAGQRTGAVSAADAGRGNQRPAAWRAAAVAAGAMLAAIGAIALIRRRMVR